MLNIKSLALVLLSISVCGCFAKIQTLPEHQRTSGNVFGELHEPDLLVGIAVSGGGSRAATFAAGAIEALATYQVKDGDRSQSLLELVTHMSSVSGGSLATAYYALNKPGRSEPVLEGSQLSRPYQKFFSQFKQDMQLNFQRRAVARQLLFFRAFNPTKLAYSLAEVWDSNFLKDRTIADLFAREQQGDTPRIILNGTIYNTGRRLALTTIGPQEFSYDFVRILKSGFDQHGVKLTPTGEKEYNRTIATARTQFMPLTFEEIGLNHATLPISRAVASSASFPPIVGPITYQSNHGDDYVHVGDGGLFDNLGTESLTTLFLNKVPRTGPSRKRGIIIVIDSSFPFAAGEMELSTNPKGFQVFRKDPSRIVGIMEARANAYQTLLWQSLRSHNDVLPDYNHLKLMVLRHTDAAWTGGYAALPTACRDYFEPSATEEDIRKAVSLIPTLFKIENDCHGELLISAAKQAVEQQRELLDSFFTTTPTAVSRTP